MTIVIFLLLVFVIVFCFGVLDYSFRDYFNANILHEISFDLPPPQVVTYGQYVAMVIACDRETATRASHLVEVGVDCWYYYYYYLFILIIIIIINININININRHELPYI